MHKCQRADLDGTHVKQAAHLQCIDVLVQLSFWLHCLRCSVEAQTAIACTSSEGLLDGCQKQKYMCKCSWRCACAQYVLACMAASWCNVLHLRLHSGLLLTLCILESGARLSSTCMCSAPRIALLVLTLLLFHSSSQCERNSRHSACKQGVLVPAQQLS
jgi:hypothetical protein